MITPEVTIVIPLFNKGSHIARALNSVLSQTSQNFEVIIVDDGSADNGVEIVRGFSDSRIFLIQQKNQGASIARNLGVKHAKANLIAFLDADDEWTQTHLEIILKLRKNYPQAGMYATAYQIVTHNGNLRRAKYKYVPVPPWEGLLPNFFKTLAFGDTTVRTSLVAIPKNIFCEFGGFPPGYKWEHDMGLYGKIALRYQVAFSWELGGIYHKDSVNRLSDMKRPIDYEEPFLKTAHDALMKAEVRSEFIQPINEYIFRQEIPRVIKCILSGNSETARNILSQCQPKQYNYYTLKKTLFLATFLPNHLIQKIKKSKFLIKDLHYF